MVLYFFAFFSVTKGFIEKVVSQLAHIDLTSPEYNEICDEYTQDDNINVNDIPSSPDNNDRNDDQNPIISSLKFQNPSITHKQTSVRVYEAYKGSIQKSGAKILLHEAFKCILVM